jgi:hypothetical protein
VLKNKNIPKDSRLAFTKCGFFWKFQRFYK